MLKTKRISFPRRMVSLTKLHTVTIITLPLQWRLIVLWKFIHNFHISRKMYAKDDNCSMEFTLQRHLSLCAINIFPSKQPPLNIGRLRMRKKVNHNDVQSQGLLLLGLDTIVGSNTVWDVLTGWKKKDATMLKWLHITQEISGTPGDQQIAIIIGFAIILILNSW
jgi:hypothetical protein